MKKLKNIHELELKKLTLINLYTLNKAYISNNTKRLTKRFNKIILFKIKNKICKDYKNVLTSLGQPV